MRRTAATGKVRPKYAYKRVFSERDSQSWLAFAHMACDMLQRGQGVILVNWG